MRAAAVALPLAAAAQLAVAQGTAMFPGTTAVGASAAPISVTVTMTGTGSAGNLAVLTQGTANKDFVLAGGGSCSASGTYSVGQQCTVNVIFKPQYPGLRMGAVELLDGGGGLLGEALVNGVATGSLAILAPGRIDTVAGTKFWFYVQDGVLATTAPIFIPQGVVSDAVGNFYIGDTGNNRVRRVDVVTGFISTVAGNGTPGVGANGVAATSTMLSSPAGLAMDGAGNLYIADSGNGAIRKVDAVTGIITTVAGELGNLGYSGDGGLATSAQLSLPEGLAFDSAGNMYIADSGNNLVRRVDASTGIITTVAGTGTAGYNGDNIPATTAQLSGPWNVAVGLNGTLYIADLSNNRVRKVSGGTITTVAGNGTQGYSGDNAAASVAELNAPEAVVLDPAGDIYIADSGNNRVREVSASTGKITTISGNNSQGFAGDGGPANAASLNGPSALYFDQGGNLYIADFFDNRIREISGTTIALSYPTIKVSKFSDPQLVTVENAGNTALNLQTQIFDQSTLDGATTTCVVGSSMASTTTCVLGVVFAPTVIGSPDTGTLKQPSDAGNSPIVITLSGNVLAVEPTTESLISNANPALVGSPVTFTATIAASDAVTGTVDFFDGATNICPAVALSASNQATCTTSTLTLGQHTIKANYSGDADNAAATAQLVQQIKQDPGLTLVVTPNPAITGQTVTLKLTTAPATGTVTGSVVFFDGGTQIGSANLSAGAATITTSTLVAGTHQLSVQYAGDTTNMAGNSNVVSEVVNLATTATTIATTNADVIVGTSITLSSTVTLTTGTLPITGTVQFMDGSTSLGQGTVTAGKASLTLSTLAPGSHNIVAVYSGDANSATSSSAPLLQKVEQIGTVTTLSSDTNPSFAGATVNFTATVAIGAGFTADGPLTGTVTFTQNGTVLGTGTVNASGQATVAVNSLNAGTDSIIATYSGNTNYSTSTSAALVETVKQSSSSTAVVASLPTVTVGQAETFTATVTSPTITPNGTVNFLIGGVVIGSGPLNASGVATFTTTSLNVGTQTIQAAYAGTVNFGASTATVSVVVVQATSVTSLLSSANPQTVGQNLTLTATVTSTDPGLTGTVNFMDGATSLGSATLTNGTASLNTSGLAFGSHTITAVYSGDTNHTTSTSTALTEHIVQGGTVALLSSVNPSVSGQNVIFTAKVAGVNGLIPSGSAVFSDGATVLGTSTLDGTGAATFAISTLIVGSHSISVAYSGDTNYSTGTAALVQTVQSASTQVNLTASQNPAIYGTAVVLTATITSNGTPATGSVTFTDGGTQIGTAVLNSSGVATLSVSTFTPGSHSIVANYAGDGNTGASLSTPLTLIVKEVTGTALASSENPALTLDAVTLTATVTNAGVGTPTGTVTFTDGSTTLGTVNVSANGTASITLQPLAQGNHTLTAVYSGDGNNFASTSTSLVEGVTLRPTTTSLTASQNNPNNPQQVTLIAVVRGNSGGAVNPSGTVTFTSNGVTIGTATLDVTGVATINIQLQSPTEVVVATYSGDTSFATSASLATTVTGGPAAQFTVTATPNNPSVVSGQHITLALSMTSVKNFADTLQMGCLGLPIYATCTFTDPQVKLAAGGTATTTVVVDTGNPLGSGAQASLQHSNDSRIVLAFLPAGLLLGFGLFNKRRRKLASLALVAFVAAITMVASGCSGLQTKSTPPGTYTFTITAQGQGTGVSESQAVTLTVTAQ
ncbi:MAG: Ig-like domain repeat protein [Acidobacteriota bacterium]